MFSSIFGSGKTWSKFHTVVYEVLLSEVLSAAEIGKAISSLILTRSHFEPCVVYLNVCLLESFWLFMQSDKTCIWFTCIICNISECTYLMLCSFVQCLAFPLSSYDRLKFFTHLSFLYFQMNDVMFSQFRWHRLKICFTFLTVALNLVHHVQFLFGFVDCQDQFSISNFQSHCEARDVCAVSSQFVDHISDFLSSA
jgi:hypothetical protein